MKVFSNNGYDAMIFVLDVNNNTFSRDSNYIIDVVRWPTFDNSSTDREKYHNVFHRCIIDVS